MVLMTSNTFLLGKLHFTFRSHNKLIPHLLIIVMSYINLRIHCNLIHPLKNLSIWLLIDDMTSASPICLLTWLSNLCHMAKKKFNYVRMPNKKVYLLINYSSTLNFTKKNFLCCFFLSNSCAVFFGFSDLFGFDFNSFNPIMKIRNWMANFNNETTNLGLELDSSDGPPPCRASWPPNTIV